MNGLDVSSESLAALFSVDPALWRKEVARSVSISRNTARACLRRCARN